MAERRVVVRLAEKPEAAEVQPLKPSRHGPANPEEPVRRTRGDVLDPAESYAHVGIREFFRAFGWRKPRRPQAARSTHLAVQPSAPLARLS